MTKEHTTAGLNITRDQMIQLLNGIDVDEAEVLVGQLHERMAAIHQVLKFDAKQVALRKGTSSQTSAQHFRSRLMCRN